MCTLSTSQTGDKQRLIKALEYQNRSIDYKAHDLIRSRIERDEHITTGRSLSLEEELLHHHQRVDQGPTPPGGAAKASPLHHMVWPAPGPSPSRLLAP